MGVIGAIRLRENRRSRFILSYQWIVGATYSACTPNESTDYFVEFHRGNSYVEQSRQSTGTGVVIDPRRSSNFPPLSGGRGTSGEWCLTRETMSEPIVYQYWHSAALSRDVSIIRHADSARKSIPNRFTIEHSTPSRTERERERERDKSKEKVNLDSTFFNRQTLSR